MEDTQWGDKIQSVAWKIFKMINPDKGLIIAYPPQERAFQDDP